jgi:hypothetical protein
MVMYVGDDGFLPQDAYPHTCKVSYVSPPKLKKTKTLQMRHVDATVCGMLRYEYALEVQSRFINSQSRIGLDFVSSGDSNIDLVEVAE